MELGAGVSFWKAPTALSFRSTRDWKSAGVTTSLWARSMAATDRRTAAIVLYAYLPLIEDLRGLDSDEAHFELFGQALHGQCIYFTIVVSRSGFFESSGPKSGKTSVFFRLLRSVAPIIPTIIEMMPGDAARGKKS